MAYDLSKATLAGSPGGYDLTKSAQSPSGPAAAAGMLRGARQAPVTSSDHPLAGHSPPKARYSPKGKKGKAIIHEMMREVEDDDMPRKQKVAVALSKARRRGVKIPKRY